MAERWYIHPDEIIAEIRRLYPTEKVFGPASRPVAPRVTFANEHLYGVLVYVYGEGVKGQYLRHGYFDREGQRYWLIQLGWVTLYGRMRDGKIVPLVVLGLPTRFVVEYKPQDFTNFILEEIPLRSMECKESQMINLDRVLQGRDPILIVDKYDLLRGNGGAPSEFIDRIVEQQRLIEALQRTVWEYEKVINDYKTNINILRARVSKLQELVASYENKLIKLSNEVTGIQQELIRLREEILTRGAEAESLEETRRRLRDMIDDLTDLIKDLADWITVLKRTLEVRKKEVEGQ